MKKLIIAMLLLLFSTYSNHPMQRLATKLGQTSLKSIAKKGFSGFMTGLHWGIAGGLPMFLGSASIFCQMNEEKLYRNAHQETSAFIMSQSPMPLKGVKVDPNLDLFQNPARAGKNHIFVSRSYNEKIKEALEENDQNALNKFNGLLAHEINHIKNNDLSYIPSFMIVIPFITHKSIKTFHKYIDYQPKAQNFWTKQIVKIPTGFGKLIINAIGIIGVNRYIEQRADDQVPNNIETLNGLKCIFKEHQKEKDEMLSQLNQNQRKIISLADSLLDLHPSTESRIAKLDQRIERIKQEQIGLQQAKKESA